MRHVSRMFRGESTPRRKAGAAGDSYDLRYYRDGTTPLGVAGGGGPGPRVARGTAQPWALGQNPLRGSRRGARALTDFPRQGGRRLLTVFPRQGSVSQEGLCGARCPLVASAQPRCGCWDCDTRTQGSAGDRATLGFRAEPALGFQEGGGKFVAHRVPRGYVSGEVGVGFRCEMGCEGCSGFPVDVICRAEDIACD